MSEMGAPIREHLECKGERLKKERELRKTPPVDQCRDCMLRKMVGSRQKTKTRRDPARQEFDLIQQQ
jgi:hypothetical protein